MARTVWLGIWLMAMLPAMLEAQSRTSAKGTDETEQEDDPCITIDDRRYCWTLDPFTGAVRPARPDTSFVNYSTTDVMERKTMALNYTGNLWSPHQSDQYFLRPPVSDFIFVDAYDLFASAPDRQLYYNTRVPFTVASYLTSGSNLQSNDHFMLDFAGNFSSRVGLGTSLDYVYARGEYQSQGTKPLKWLAYLYYTGERYKAYLSTNISFYGNQENGGITDRGYVLSPERYNSNFTDPTNMPTNLVDTWNSTDHHEASFTHTYDLGFTRVTMDADSVEEETFVPVATIFHNIDIKSYDRTFRMDKGAQDTEQPFFSHNYINPETTSDTVGYKGFSTHLGLRLNEGFHRWSQFGLAAFVGYEYQKYTNLQDTLDLSYIASEHTSHNVWIGGQISRHRTTALTFDITARTCLSGDKVGDVDVHGTVGTVLPFLRGDSLILTASGFIRNSRVSYFMDHYFSNHFRWSNDFDREQRMRIEGSLFYPRTRTTVSAGIEHVNNFHYFNADGLPAQYDKQLDVFSLEAHQSLRWGILHWDNALLFQTTTGDEVLSLPKLSARSGLSIRFRIARALDTQLGVNAYYHTSYYAPNYQPATQQFCAQHDIQCGNFPLFDAYVNCHLKRIRFFFMMYNMLDGAITNDAFIGPYYPTMPRRMEWGVSIDFQN